jgi:hypothetical protein
MEYAYGPAFTPAQILLDQASNRIFFDAHTTHAASVTG